MQHGLCAASWSVGLMENLGECLCYHCRAEFWLGKQEFPLPLLPRQRLLWLPVSTKGDKLCVLSIGRVSLTCCMLVPEHRWPQGAWQLPPLGNHRKAALPQELGMAQGPEQPVCAACHTCQKEAVMKTSNFQSCLWTHLEIMKTSTKQPRSPPWAVCHCSLWSHCHQFALVGSTWPQQSAANCSWSHKELSAKGPP